MRILVVRRDNIGDLVCTTPLVAGLRKRHPQAWIGALVNSYNAPVLERNPDLDEVIAYRKLKHLVEGESALGALASRLGAFWRLRAAPVDYALLATPDFALRTVRLARWLGARRVVGFSDGSHAARALDLSVPLSQVSRLHEVERVYSLGGYFGIDDEIPSLRLVPDPAAVGAAEHLLRDHATIKLAIHISARRPAQRWPAGRFIELIGALAGERAASVMLLWSPGSADHAQHPGDDAKAAQIVGAFAGRADAVTGYRTARLPELIGALAAADAVLCSDGGAMHLAAALGKPIACLFGDSPVERWRPWGVPHRVLSPQSGDVADISVGAALQALRELLPGRALKSAP